MADDIYLANGSIRHVLTSNLGFRRVAAKIFRINVTKDMTSIAETDPIYKETITGDKT